MNDILVDSNVLLDIFEDDPVWANWSEATLEQYSQTHRLCINPIIYAEVSIGFEQLTELETALTGCGVEIIAIPKEALFRAGKAFVDYRKRGGNKTSPLPDFFIGAHAEVAKIPLITRDSARYKTYFPAVHIIAPHDS